MRVPSRETNMSTIIMGKTLHIHGCPKSIVYKYRQPTALPKLKFLTEKPVQGPIDLFTLRHVPVATAILETESTSQRVLVALEEEYDRPVGEMSCFVVDIDQIKATQTEMNLPLCILFQSETPNVDDCVFINPPTAINESRMEI